ncbi:MAG TPA: CpaD family pilus assembly protein [Allosphingosinicella sp.]
MMSARKLTALALLGTGLAGCVTGPSGPITADNNPSLYSVHQPVVERSDFVLDLDASGDTLSAAEQARLIGWFRSIELRYGDQLFVEEPRDYPSPGARADVARMLADYGLFLREGAPVVAGSVGPGTVRIIASRAVASVPGCPDWSANDAQENVNTSSNYGCAVNSNFAAMVANPNDLVLGQQGSGNGSAATANRAVRVYRERQPTGTQPLAAPSTRSGGN